MSNIINSKKFAENFLIIFSMAVIFIFFYIEYGFFRDVRNNLGKSGSLPCFSLFTDKAVYGPEESVNIVIKNYSKASFSENLDGKEVKALVYLGENYGVGLIEKNIGGEWVAVEPIWRCDKPCFERCGTDGIMHPEESKIFKWDQIIRECSLKLGHEVIEKAGKGTYRAVISSWDTLKNEHKIVYSNEFKIKGSDLSLAENQQYE